MLPHDSSSSLQFVDSASCFAQIMDTTDPAESPHTNPDCSISDTLAFGVSGEKFLRLHPIYKALPGDSIVSSSCRRCRPKCPNASKADGVRVKTDEISSSRVVESLGTKASRSNKIGTKRRAERRDCEVSYVKEEKIDSNKFEYLLEKLWGRFPKEQTNGFAIIDSLWFFSYTKGPLKGKVLRWITDKKTFSNRYVFVPIVIWGHWSLLICCHFGETCVLKKRSRCMLLLDSLQNVNVGGLESSIRRFVFDVLKSEKQLKKEDEDLIGNIPLLIPKVPQQEDGEACGSFVLYCIYEFIERAPMDFSISDGYPYFVSFTSFVSSYEFPFQVKFDSQTRHLLAERRLVHLGRRQVFHERTGLNEIGQLIWYSDKPWCGLFGLMWMSQLP